MSRPRNVVQRLERIVLRLWEVQKDTDPMTRSRIRRDVMPLLRRELQDARDVIETARMRRMEKKMRGKP